MSLEVMGFDPPTFVDILREEFEARIERKTGWGNQELKLEFEKAMIRALARTMKGV